MESFQKPKTVSSSFKTIKDDPIMINNSLQNETQACSPAKNKMPPTTSKESTPLETEESNNEATGADKMILLHPNSSFSLEESVFSIDHILEAILGELDRSTLLNLRLVSRRWAIFGAKTLQRIVTIRFFQPKPLFRFKTIKNLNMYYAGFGQNRSIEDLMAVMKNSAEFPSASFSFLNRHDIKANETIQPFLNSYGASIKKLSFDGNLRLNDVRRLLLTQTPNLETLLMIQGHIILFDEATSDDVKLNAGERAGVSCRLFDDDETATTTTAAPKPKQILKNLKIFKCPSIIPDEFLSQLLEACPNLVEIFLPPQNLPCLLRPVNRLHLIKKLVIAFNKNNTRPLELVANPHNHQFKWRAEQLFNYGHNVYHDKDYYERMVKVMSGITAGVASTCKKLVWATFLKDFELPKMPHVKRLIVTYDESDNPLLREDESLAEKFPSLESLVIHTDDDTLDDEDLIIDDVLGGFYNRQPVDSTVRNVTLDFHPCGNFFQSCKKLFPNSTVKTRYLPKRGMMRQNKLNETPR